MPIFRRRWRTTYTAACWITTVITRWHTPCAASTWNWRFCGIGRPPGRPLRLAIRQVPAERFVPEVYIAAANADVPSAVDKRVAALQTRWPGLTAMKSGADIRIVVPEKFRVGHEEHFGQVTNRFFEYVTSPKSLPAWETPYMLAKYAVSTKGVEIGRK